jgi:bacillolysin
MSCFPVRWAGPRALVMALTLGVALISTSATAQDAQEQTVSRAITVTAGAQDLRALSDWDHQIDSLSGAGLLRLRMTREDTLLPGRTHERFDEYYQGVRVFGAQLVRQVANGQAVSVFGTFHPSIAIDARPSLNEDDALARARDLTGGLPLSGSVPELVILPKEDGSYALAWYVRVLTRKDLVALFVDAKSGAEAFRYSDLETDAAVGTGLGVLGDRKKISTDHVGGAYFANDKLRPPSLTTFDMKGDVNRTFSVLFGSSVIGPLLGLSDQAMDTDNKWTDGANVDTHVYMGFTYDYYFKRFGRKGLDNGNRPMYAITHPVNRSDIAQADEDTIDFYLNAFWCGECGPGGVGLVMYGEGLPVGYYLSGSGQYVNYFSAGLDVVSHELSHGVTQYTSGLIYMNESGALNEAFSDIMGRSVKSYFRPGGSLTLNTEYVLGADVFVPFLAGSVAGLRNFAFPTQFGDPDHYSLRYTGPDDNGGVHFNCTIPDHVFYLAIEGGTNRVSHVTVTGVGNSNREQIEKVFYRGFTSLLPPDATFAVARRATLQAAIDLYGGDSAAYRAVSQAWDAVGVF